MKHFLETQKHYATKCPRMLVFCYEHQAISWYNNKPATSFYSWSRDHFVQSQVYRMPFLFNTHLRDIYSCSLRTISPTILVREKWRAEIIW